MSRVGGGGGGGGGNGSVISCVIYIYVCLGALYTSR